MLVEVIDPYDFYVYKYYIEFLAGIDLHIEEEYVSSRRSELATSATLRAHNESDYDDEDGDAGNDAAADENDNDDTTDEHYDDVVKEFRCSLCENMFRSEVELVAHKRAAHMRRRTGGNEPCTCPVCKKTFKNKPSLSAHVSVQHRRRVSLVCDFVNDKVYFHNFLKIVFNKKISIVNLV